MAAHTLQAEFGDISATKRNRSEKWANIWFDKLCRFHHRPNDSKWRFTVDHVIAFLQSKVKAGYPAWKRLKIVEWFLGLKPKALVECRSATGWAQRSGESVQREVRIQPWTRYEN